jgi:hypothetical protein
LPAAIISERYPQLGMQALLADITVRVYPGETLELPVPATTIGDLGDGDGENGAIKQVIPVPVPANGQLKWITPAEGTTPNEPRYNWQVTILRHAYLSSNTRNFNRADGTRAKDGLYSLIDYLDPKATDAFLHITHDTYYGAVGDQFGKTILGFFGDEPEYQYTPWSPTLQEQFKAQKGYDVTPYMSQWFDRQPTGSPSAQPRITPTCGAASSAARSSASRPTGRRRTTWSTWSTSATKRRCSRWRTRPPTSSAATGMCRFRGSTT